MVIGCGLRRGELLALRVDTVQLREERWVVADLLGVILKITRQEGHVLLRQNEEGPGQLFPEAELRSFSKTSDDVVTFELDGNGRVARLVIHTGGRSVAVNRIE